MAHTPAKTAAKHKESEREIYEKRERNDSVCNEEGRSGRKEEEHKKNATRIT